MVDEKYPSEMIILWKYDNGMLTSVTLTNEELIKAVTDLVDNWTD